MNIRILKHGLLKLLTAFLLLPLLSACGLVMDSYDIEEPVVDILSRFDAEGKAWLNLEIPLGYASNTRMTTFNDGDEAEYTVHNMTIVLFHGTNEDNARVASTYTFTWTETMDAATQVTKTLRVTSDNIERGNNVYLLAILNYTPSLATGMPFNELKSTLTSITTTYSGTDYYVMANAPLATANNGTGTVQTLVKLDPSLFFATEEEAVAHPASHIYVERLAAKVSVELGNIPTITNTLPEGNHASYTDYYITGNPNLVFTDNHIAEYSIYNYNIQGYLVRHFEADNNAENWLPLHRDADYRFVELAALPYGSTRYRTYWAKDNKYSENMYNSIVDAKNVVFKEWKDIKTKASGSTGESDYCAENTMDLDHMNIRNSTLVLVRLNLNNYTSFYTTSVTGSDVIYQLPKNPNSEEGTSAQSSFTRQQTERYAMSRSTTPVDDPHYYVSSAKTIDEYLREWLMQTNANVRLWVEKYAAGNPKHIKIDLKGADNRNCGPLGGGPAIVTCSQTANTSSECVSDFSALSLDAFFANNITVNFYDDGYCYYLVPIMHFGDAQTPWASAGSMTAGTAPAAYASDDNTYLGRYGVVRNNWYTVSISGVNHVGACNGWMLFEKMADQADDTVEQLLNAKLIISPWAAEESTLIITTTP